MRLYLHRKFYAGAMFCCIGLFAALWSTHYTIGTVTRLGPGGFPLILGLALVLLGIAQMVTGVSTHGGETIAWWEGKAMLLIPLSIAIFGATVERYGLMPAIASTALVAGLANPSVRYLELIGLSIVLAFFGAGVFVYALGLPIALWAHW